MFLVATKFTLRFYNTYSEDKFDHHSYTHNLGSCEIEAWKNPV